MALTPEEIAEKEFAFGLRGYDQEEVRAFLHLVAAEVASGAFGVGSPGSRCRVRGRHGDDAGGGGRVGRHRGRPGPGTGHRSRRPIVRRAANADAEIIRSKARAVLAAAEAARSRAWWPRPTPASTSGSAPSASNWRLGRRGGGQQADRRTKRRPSALVARCPGERPRGHPAAARGGARAGCRSRGRGRRRPTRGHAPRSTSSPAPDEASKTQLAELRNKLAKVTCRPPNRRPPTSPDVTECGDARMDTAVVSPRYACVTHTVKPPDLSQGEASAWPDP
jgi:DivIVA domain-containing protein